MVFTFGGFCSILSSPSMASRFQATWMRWEGKDKGQRYSEMPDFTSSLGWLWRPVSQGPVWRKKGNSRRQFRRPWETSDPEPLCSSTPGAKWGWLEVPLTLSPSLLLWQSLGEKQSEKMCSSLQAEGKSSSAHWAGWFLSVGCTLHGASRDNITRHKPQPRGNRLLRNSVFLVKKGWFLPHKRGPQISWHGTVSSKSGSALGCVILPESWWEAKQRLSQGAQIFQGCPVGQFGLLGCKWKGA